MLTYDCSSKSSEHIERSFTYHKPIGDQPERYVELRNNAKDLAYLIVSLSPVSREQSLAITNLEQAIFWANAAIARNEKEEDLKNVTGDK